MSELLGQVEQLAGRAGEIALSYYGRVAFTLKGDASPVSRADREIEVFLREELCRLDPAAAYIGEETARDQEMVERARQAERVWVVDPIDGTAAFLGELDSFSICIGQLREGRPALGVVWLPALEQAYAAERGSGALWRSRRGVKPIRVAAEENRATSCLLVPSNAHRSYRVGYAGKLRSLGSTAYHFALVARGPAIGAFSRSHVWDYAAAAAVLEEAGGVLRRLDGTALDWRSLLDGHVIDMAVLGAHPARWEQLAPLIKHV